MVASGQKRMPDNLTKLVYHNPTGKGLITYSFVVDVFIPTDLILTGGHYGLQEAATELFAWVIFRKLMGR